MFSVLMPRMFTQHIRKISSQCTFWSTWIAVATFTSGCHIRDEKELVKLKSDDVQKVSEYKSSQTRFCFSSDYVYPDSGFLTLEVCEGGSLSGERSFVSSNFIRSYLLSFFRDHKSQRAVISLRPTDFQKVSIADLYKSFLLVKASVDELGNSNAGCDIVVDLPPSVSQVGLR